MNDDKLIYEKYLEENIKQAALSVLCALGLGTGCSTINKGIDMITPKPKEFNPDDRFNPNNPDFLRSLQYLFDKLSDNEKQQLQRDIQQLLITTGTPDEGWDKWVNDWMKQRA